MNKFKNILIGLFLVITLASFAIAQDETNKISPETSKFSEDLRQVFYPFNGQWLPDLDPALIGVNNFKTLINMRPIDAGIEGTQGYTKVNTSIINTNYFKPRSGYHFKKDYPPESHILIQAYNWDGTQSKIWDNETLVPNQGNFNSTAIHDDASFGTFTGTYGQNLKFEDIASSTGTIHKTKFENTVSSTGTAHNTKFEDISVDLINTFETYRSRFSKGPKNQVIYSNGVETQIWGGKESQVAVFFLSSSNVTEYVTNPRNYTSQINNTLDTSAERVTIDASGGTAYFLVAAPRPISGVSFYMQSFNATAGAFVKFSEWNGATWGELTETDGTSGLSANGEISFASTVSTSKAKYLEGGLYYWYLGQLSAGSAVVKTVTMDIPWQDIKDLWDGVYRIPITFQAEREGNYQDWTLEVAEGSSSLFPIGAEIGGLGSGGSDHLIIGFEDRMQAIYFEILSGNTNAFGPDTTISYWNGTTWTASGVTYDGTGGGEGFSGVTPLGISGALSWQPPDHRDEFQQYLFGVQGWFYKVKYGDTLGGDGAPDDFVIIDRVYGVPAPYKLNNFKFASYFKDHIFLFGYLKGNEANRVDYSASNASEVWNGRETSDNGRNSFYIGGGEELTNSAQIFNRYGNNLHHNMLIFKKNELYLLSGDGPEDFKVLTVSENIGCPAPNSVSSLEVGYEMISGELQRNIIVWISSSGPYLFDGSILKPLKGIDKYFDKNDPNYFGSGNIANSFAWFDPNYYREWNIRVGDLWFTYSFDQQKWYQRDTGTAELPMVAFQVVDASGDKYIYGGIDTGYMMRMENGNNWDGTDIDFTIETGDFFAGGNGWYQTLLRRIKVASKVIPENDRSVDVTYYRDGLSSGTSVFSYDLDDGTPGIITRKTKALNETAWLHRLKFESSTSATVKGFQPLGFGIEFRDRRDDH